jgi:hypothetical protein
LNIVDQNSKSDHVSFLLRDSYNMLLYDTKDGLKLVNCEDYMCQNRTFVSLSPNRIGQTNILLNNNLPIISYHDLSTNSLKLIHCDNKLCDKYHSEVIENGFASNHSLIISSEGPILAYHSLNENKVKYWKSGVSKVLADGGWDLTMDITIDGIPAIVFNNEKSLMFLKCRDMECDNVDVNEVRPKVKSPKLMNNRLVPMILYDGGVIVCQNLKCH